MKTAFAQTLNLGLVCTCVHATRRLHDVISTLLFIRLRPDKGQWPNARYKKYRTSLCQWCCKSLFGVEMTPHNSIINLFVSFSDSGHKDDDLIFVILNITLVLFKYSNWMDVHRSGLSYILVYIILDFCYLNQVVLTGFF